MEEELHTNSPIAATTVNTDLKSSNIDIRALNEKIQKESSFVELKMLYFGSTFLPRVE